MEFYKGLKGNPHVTGRRVVVVVEGRQCVCGGVAGGSSSGSHGPSPPGWVTAAGTGWDELFSPPADTKAMTAASKCGGGS